MFLILIPHKQSEQMKVIRITVLMWFIEMIWLLIDEMYYCNNWDINSMEVDGIPKGSLTEQTISPEEAIKIIY